MPDNDDANDNFIILDDEDDTADDTSFTTRFGRKPVSGQLNIQMASLAGLDEEERGLVWKDALQEFAAVAGALIFSGPNFEPTVTQQHKVEVTLELCDDEFGSGDEPFDQLH